MFAARLGEAGLEVSLIGRGSRFEKIRERGLSIASGSRVRRSAVRVTDNPLGVGPVDLVVVAVAAPAIAQAASAVEQLVAEHTAVMGPWVGRSVQEGAAAAYTGTRFLPMAAYLEVAERGPGLIEERPPGVVFLGEPGDGGVALPLTVDLVAHLRTAGFDARVTAEPWREVDRRWLFSCSLEPLSLLSSKSIGKLLENDEHRDAAACLLEEAGATLPGAGRRGRFDSGALLEFFTGVLPASFTAGGGRGAGREARGALKRVLRESARRKFPAHASRLAYALLNSR